MLQNGHICSRRLSTRRAVSSLLQSVVKYAVHFMLHSHRIGNQKLLKNLEKFASFIGGRKHRKFTRFEIHCLLTSRLLMISGLQDLSKISCSSDSEFLCNHKRIWIIIFILFVVKRYSGAPRRLGETHFPTVTIQQYWPTFFLINLLLKREPAGNCFSYANQLHWKFSV